MPTEHKKKHVNLKFVDMFINKNALILLLFLFKPFLHIRYNYKLINYSFEKFWNNCFSTIKIDFLQYCCMIYK